MRSTLPRLLSVALIALFAAGGCGDRGREEGLEALEILAPREGTVFPPGFTRPTFVWVTSGEDTAGYRVSVEFAEGPGLVRAVEARPPSEAPIDERALGATNEVFRPHDADRRRAWTPDPDTWAEIQRRSRGSVATVRIGTVAADGRPEPTRVGTVRIATSTDPLEAPVFYRDVPLMPAVAEESGVIRPLAEDAIGLIEWRLRDLSRPESKVVLTDMPSCANCHSFSSDGKTLAMDVDGPTGDKGAYAIAPIEKTTVIGPEQVITWNSYPDKPEGHKTIGFLSRVSPDGKYVLTTLNEALYVANFADFRFLQVFFPTRGILAYYSVETGEIKALPGANDPAFVHTNGVWTPDGKNIVFSRAKAFDPYVPGRPPAKFPNDPNEPEIRYDLHRIPFDGGRGGVPEPIEGASANGMSNTFPKVSPDGRWIVYTKCRNGQLMRPDGRLWIVPFAGGEAREMRCNTDRMNSWHSFSPDGRWMVFSSKTDTPYTQMFLTHIDEDGSDTPALLVPQSTAPNRAVNIPEFLNVDYDSFARIEVPAVEHHRLYFEGVDLARDGRYAEAIPVLRRALETEPQFSRAYVTLGLARMELGQVDEARADFERALELDPTSSEAHNNLGLAFLRRDRLDDAVPHLRRAIAINVLNGRAEHNLALALSRQGRYAEADPHFERAAALEPDDAEIPSDHGYVLTRLGRHERAVRALERALALAPEHARARENLAQALLEAGDHPRAVATLADLLERAPANHGTRLRLAWLLATSPDETVRDGARAVSLLEARPAASETAASLDVKAAALAEAGRFAEALAAARRAKGLVAQGEGETASGLDERIAAYEARRPWRQRPKAP